MANLDETKSLAAVEKTLSNFKPKDHAGIFELVQEADELIAKLSKLLPIIKRRLDELGGAHGRFFDGSGGK
jgi:hypothetical protein